LAQAKAVFKTGETLQLREPGVSNHIDFDPENDYTEVENRYFWNNTTEISI
jgi:hypothetical protein